MALKSRWSEPIPNCSLQQWIFGSCSEPIEDSDKTIFIDVDRPDTQFLTKNQFRLLSKQLALGLIKAGLRPGERTLVFSSNNIYFPSIFLGILMSGGIFTGANPAFTPRELAYQLKDSAATFMFVVSSQLDTALEAAKIAGLSRDKIFVLDPSISPPVDSTAILSQAQPKDGLRLWTDLLEGNQEQAKTWQWVEPTDPQTTACCLNYSSGTTGVPKGVEITHSSYVANGVGVILLAHLEPDTDLQKRARALCFLPMYHAYAQTYFIANHPHLGTPAYIMASFDFEKMLQHVQRFRITSLTCVPPILVYLSKHPLVKKYDLSSVERVGSGAAPLSREVAESVERLWTDQRVNIKQGWGMTEVTCTCMTWDPRLRADPSAVGELAPNCSGKIMDLEGKSTMPPGERGELWVTGPTLMKGYWRNPSATESTIHVDEDGTRWLKTGDIAYVESSKPGAIFHIVDRIKELIKVKGNQVAPAELEAVLLDHPEIADAAVVGVPFEEDEVPRAYLVKTPGSQLTEKQVVDWMEARVARYKRLKGGAAFVDVIPKNPSGKILRRSLKEKAKKDLDPNQPPTSRL